MTKAFDNALFVPSTPVAGNIVEVTDPGPPLVTSYSFFVTASASGITVDASVPAANAAGQTLVAGPAPDFAWESSEPPIELPPATAEGQLLVSGGAPDYAWNAAPVSVPGLPAAIAQGQELVAGPAPDFAWTVADPTPAFALPAASAPGQALVSGAAPSFDWIVGSFPTGVPAPTGPNLMVVTGSAAPFAYQLSPIQTVLQPNAQGQIMVSNASPAWALQTVSGMLSAAGAITTQPTGPNQVLLSSTGTPPTWTLSTISALLAAGGAVMNATGGSLAQAANLVFAATPTLTTRIDGGSPAMSAIDNFTIDSGVY